MRNIWQAGWALETAEKELEFDGESICKDPATGSWHPLLAQQLVLVWVLL